MPALCKAWLPLLATLLAAPASAAVSEVILQPPPLGTTDPMTVTVLQDVEPSLPYRVITMLSPDGAVFYHKGHDELVDPVTGRLEVHDWAKATSDAEALYVGAWAVPAAFDVASFVCEGSPPPASLDGAPHTLVRRDTVVVAAGGNVGSGAGVVGTPAAGGGAAGGGATATRNATTAGGGGGGSGAEPISAQASGLHTSGAPSLLNAWQGAGVAAMVGLGIAVQLAAAVWA